MAIEKKVIYYTLVKMKKSSGVGWWGAGLRVYRKMSTKFVTWVADWKDHSIEIV